MFFNWSSISSPTFIITNFLLKAAISSLRGPENSPLRFLQAPACHLHHTRLHTTPALVYDHHNRLILRLCLCKSIGHLLPFVLLIIINYRQSQPCLQSRDVVPSTRQRWLLPRVQILYIRHASWCTKMNTKFNG